LVLCASGIIRTHEERDARTADLPVQQSTKVELIINVKTASALGLTVPVWHLADDLCSAQIWSAF
jgi:hypothetical protein